MKIFQTVLIAALAACSSDPTPKAPYPTPKPTVVAPKPFVAAQALELMRELPIGTMARVKRVVDGDTIVLENGQRLRYIGIDSPEEFDHRKPVQCYATEAAEANRRLVEGKMIVYAHGASERDRYGRLLGYVSLLDGPDDGPGTFVNEKLIRDGHAFAWAYGKDIANAAAFAAAEADAKAHQRGLWAQCHVMVAKSGREQTQAIGK